MKYGFYIAFTFGVIITFLSVILARRNERKESELRRKLQAAAEFSREVRDLRRRPHP